MSDDSGATRKLNTAPSPAIYALEKITSMRSAFIGNLRQTHRVVAGDPTKEQCDQARSLERPPSVCFTRRLSHILTFDVSRMYAQ